MVIKFTRNSEKHEQYTRTQVFVQIPDLVNKANLVHNFS